MALSPIEKQHQELLAQQSAEQRNDDQQDQAELSLYDEMLLRIDQIKSELKSIQSRAQKAQRKQVVLPEFAGYIKGALTEQSIRQDDVLVTLMIWQIDVANFVSALPIARHAIEHGWQMPDIFKRDLKNFVAEETADWVLAQELDKSTAAPIAEILGQYRAVLADLDLVDEIKAKFHKATGLVQETLGNIDAALENYQEAIDLNAQCGVKGRINRLTKQQEQQQK